MKYYISGDKTGITYGIYEGTEGKPPSINDKRIVDGIKTFKEAQKLAASLKIKVDKLK